MHKHIRTLPARAKYVDPCSAKCQCDDPTGHPCPKHTPKAYVTSGAKHYGTPEGFK